MKMKQLVRLAAFVFAASPLFASTEGDPFTGNYRGAFIEPPDNYFFFIDDTWYAQVYPLGHDKFAVRMLRTLRHRGPTIFEVEAHRVGERLVFGSDEAKGEVFADSLRGSFFFDGEWVAFELEEMVEESPSLGARAPEGAVWLFDGSSVDRWSTRHGEQEPPAEIIDGSLVIIPGGGEGKPDNGIYSDHHFEDVFLHIEFRLEYEPENRGQGRSNSGVYFQAADEIQVLDSFGLDGLWDECGAIYRVAAPKVNMAAPPLRWQTYDAIYRAPRFAEDGSLSEEGSITVYHNGFRIHHEQKLPADESAWRRNLTPGPLHLQDHGHPVRYRNIWLLDLDDAFADPRVDRLIEQLGLKNL